MSRWKTAVCALLGTWLAAFSHNVAEHGLFDDGVDAL